MAFDDAHERRIRLRELLAGPRIVFAPTCGDVISARLIELLGIPAVHCSGSALHRQSGFPDAGILTLTEMASAIALMCGSVNIPVIADADTGFGGIANVVRTVREYERAGAAAMHLEDQMTPKRPPTGGEHHDTISREEMVSKIRAAVDTRRDEQFMIIARSEVKNDPLELEQRLKACVDAGADAAWIAWNGPDQLRHLRASIDKPLIGVLPSKLSLQEYEVLGADCALLPTWLETVATNAKRHLLESFLRTGSGIEFTSNLQGIDDDRAFVQNQGAEELNSLEQRFG